MNVIRWHRLFRLPRYPCFVKMHVCRQDEDSQSGFGFYLCNRLRFGEHTFK